MKLIEYVRIEGLLLSIATATGDWRRHSNLLRRSCSDAQTFDKLKKLRTKDQNVVRECDMKGIGPITASPVALPAEMPQGQRSPPLR